ncbi:Lrp/AsnC ligand binding domain-containing protein [Streptosporangium sp. NPDC002524]|uniref:Lrp/AsnC family transcriptional regulator n=1 Tax=Streptosporangium sp. NPDC002524 TaxID=3154537 RepID=UPI0033223AC3
MVTAIVHINAEVDRIPEVAQTVAEIDGVSEVYSITGEYDLMAMVRVPAYEEIAEVVPGRINKVDGVLHTETHVAFRAYSRHDLEAAFSIGLGGSD